jgi:hypothetical protein
VIQLWSVLPILLASLLAIWLSRTDRHTTGSFILSGVIALQAIISPLFERGTGIPGAIGALAMIGCVGLLTLPRRYLGRSLLFGLLTGILAVLVDLFASPGRPMAGLIEARWFFSAAVFPIFGLLMAREFYTLDVRTKIVLGILATGVISLGVLAFFAFDRARQYEVLWSRKQRLQTNPLKILPRKL